MDQKRPYKLGPFPGCLQLLPGGRQHRPADRDCRMLRLSRLPDCRPQQSRFGVNVVPRLPAGTEARRPRAVPGDRVACR